MKLEAEDEALRQAEDDGHTPGHGQHPLDPLGGAADRKWSKDCQKSGNNPGSKRLMNIGG